MNDALETEIDAYLDPSRQKPFLPRFQSQLEHRYDQDGSSARGRSNLLVGIAAILIFDFSLSSDYQINHSVFWRFLFFRVFLFTPLAILAIAVSVRWTRRAIHDRAWFFLEMTSGLCSIFACHNLNMASSLLSSAGLMIILVFGTLVQRGSFVYALALNVLLVGAQVAMERSDTFLSPAEKNASMLLLASCGALALMANYKMEWADRTNYVFLLRETLRGERLATQNRALANLSESDALTGLPNRRHFDRVLAESIDAACQTGSSVALIMIDIDHFKRLNDTHGHLVGDHVLTEVGAFLRGGVRVASDLAARYGGEEFAIILPQTGPEAMQIAEKLRQRVQSSTIRPYPGAPPLSLTISCGVAYAVPRSAGGSLQLLAEADKALYSAKHQGRNRVCSALWTPTPTPLTTEEPIALA